MFARASEHGSGTPNQEQGRAPTLLSHYAELARPPGRTFETLVELIGHTRTATGLRVKAKFDKRRYSTGLVVTKGEMRDLALHPHAFHGDWNYELQPRAT